MNTVSDAMILQYVMPYLDYEECGRFACVSKQMNSIAMNDYGWATRHSKLTVRNAEETMDFSGFEIVQSSVHSEFFARAYDCEEPCPNTRHYRAKTLKLTKSFLHEPDLREKSVVLMYDFLLIWLPLRGSVEIAKRNLKTTEDRLAVLQNMPVLQKKRIENTKEKIESDKVWLLQVTKRVRFEDDFAHLFSPKKRRTTK